MSGAWGDNPSDDTWHLSMRTKQAASTYNCNPSVWGSDRGAPGQASCSVRDPVSVNEVV